MKRKTTCFLLLFRSIVFVIIFIAAMVASGKDLFEISYIWSVVASAVNVLTLFLLFAFLKKNGGTYAALINYEKGKASFKQIVGMALLILFVGIGGMFLAGFICYGIIPYAAPMLIAPIPFWLAVVNLFVLPITTALAEDGVYLGVGVNCFKNKYAAIFIPAFFFALQHSFIPLLPDSRYMIYRFISFLPLTIVLCRHYRKYSNPLPIVIGHIIIDMATAVQIILTSAFPAVYEMMCEM